MYAILCYLSDTYCKFHLFNCEALKKNKSLRSLNLESNNLTASGHDQKGIIELANSLKDNQCLRVLMLSKNAVAHEAAALGADRYR